jgi:protein FAM50
MGDFSAHFKRPDTGINTVEGMKSGARAAQLEKQRQKEQEEFEQRKREIAARNKAVSIEGKFSQGTTAVVEQDFKAKTVGLVTAQEFKTLAAKEREEWKTKKSLFDITEEDEIDCKKQQQTEEEMAKEKKASKKEKKKKLKAKKKLLSTLSFAGDEEGAEMVEAAVESEEPTAKKSKKDPTVDTSFLPDKERESEVQQARAKLEREWKQKQQQMQKEELEITYSYWDGSGHRRSVVCKKGDTIGDFLEKVRSNLSKEFRELGSVGADALLYVKEDLIIPQDLTFYDLIATKARGKSGPLFHFDVHDDIRLGAIDARVEKDESHPGKVVERRWYDRNKHIFPASRWEVYDPTKEYGSYTIGDKRKRK